MDSENWSFPILVFQHISSSHLEVFLIFHAKKWADDDPTVWNPKIPRFIIIVASKTVVLIRFPGYMCAQTHTQIYIYIYLCVCAHHEVFIQCWIPCEWFAIPKNGELMILNGKKRSLSSFSQELQLSPLSNFSHKQAHFFLSTWVFLVKTPAVKPCIVYVIVLLCSVGSKELSAYRL